MFKKKFTKKIKSQDKILMKLELKKPLDKI